MSSLIPKSVQEKSMESKNRQVIGRSIVLERQERFSFETNERIYLNRIYHNPLFDVARTSSSSDDIEKIHRTRERVDSLNNQINYEIERLKEFNNSLNKKKDERLMTWDERLRANPPLTNVLNKHRGHHGRSDDVSKPRCKEVKQRDVSPRKPPPKGISINGLPTKELPNELTPNGYQPKGPSPKELPKELTYLILPKKELKPKGLPVKELNPRKPAPRALPAKETPPKGLPLKEVNPRKPRSGVLPPKELPPKGLPPKNIPLKGVPAKTIPPKGPPPKTIPSKGIPPKTIPPKGLPPKTIPPKGVPSKTISSKGVPPKISPPKGFPPKTIPPKGLPPKTIPPRGVPPKTIPSKEVLLKGMPSKGIPPKSIPPKGVLPKGVPPKTIPSKEILPKRIPLKGVPPKTIPPKDLPAKRLPLRELPLKRTPPMTRTAPPKMSTQKALKPEKPPPKDVTPKNPLPKEEPMQRSLGDVTPEELAARISGGCCHCYCHCDQCYSPAFEGSCYIATDCNCNLGLGFNRGIEYGVPYCTARRRVTDLNTQEMCSNRCVGVSPDRKSSKQSSSIRESTRDKKKSPTRSGRTSPVNKMRNQEKWPKVESQEKVQKVSELMKRPERTMKEKPPLKKVYQPPVNIKQDKPKAPKKDVTKLEVSPIASPPKDQKIYVDERMYEDYLSLYYKENSKTDLLESPKPTPTYTRLQEESSAKPLRNATDRTGGHRNPIEGQRASINRNSQEVKPTISERKEHQPSKCFTEMYPGPFRYEECFEEQQDYRSPDNNRTEAVNSQHPKSSRSQDKDRQGVRPDKVMVREVPKNVFGDRSSLTGDWETGSTSYVSLPHQRQSGTPTTRQESTNTETQRSKERSPLMYPLHSFEKSTQVYNDRQSNLSSAPSSSRKTYSPTTDSRGQSTSSPMSFREGSSRKDQSPSADSRRQSTSSPISFREGTYRKAQSPSTDSHRQSPISFREESSQMQQNPTTISFGANSYRVAPSHTTDSTGDTTVMNIHYQPEDSQFSSKNSSDEGAEYDPRLDMHLLDMDAYKTQIKHPIGNTDFEDAFSTLSGKTVRSSKEFTDFQEPEMSEAEEPEEVFHTTRNDSPRRHYQSKARNMDQEKDNEYKYKYYSSPRDDIQSRCECNGYETARSIDSSKRGDKSLPLVETLCEKRTRTVTFKDEQGDLKRQRQEEEECRSHINWEPALNYRRHDSTFPNDNYTSRKSQLVNIFKDSSAEHTCLESSCDEEDAYDSCFESPCRMDEQMPSFKACPCMYQTYRQLAALCQTKSPYYR